MDFTYSRKVYLADTDAAGVIYFAKGMSICHEAYEEWLASLGIRLKDLIAQQEVALPIVHSSIDFLAPAYCGDRLTIKLRGQVIRISELTINYQIYAISNPEKLIIKALTKHVAINLETRKRVDIPKAIAKNISTTEKLQV